VTPDINKLTSPLLGSWQDTADFILENGLRVLFARRPESPNIEMRLILDGGGFASDLELSGRAGVATAILGEALMMGDQVQLASSLEALGAITHVQLMPDAAVIGLSSLATNFDDACLSYAKAITALDFKQEDFELARANRLALIKAERRDPFQVALRIIPRLVYGPDHVYARPFTGSGIEEQVAGITSDDVRGYYAAHLAPRINTLVVTGALTASDLRKALERAFKQWNAEPRCEQPAVAPKCLPKTPWVVLVDRREASQTVITAGLASYERNSRRAEAMIALDTILGGMFSSRLNLSLRERRGWTYGVRSKLLDARLRGLWLVQTAAVPDHTAQAMAEIAAQIHDVAQAHSINPDEFSRAINHLVARIPASYETCAQMADALANTVVHRLPISSPRDLAGRLQQLKPDDVTQTCQELLGNGGLQWVVVGAANQLIRELHRAGFEQISVLDGDSA